MGDRNSSASVWTSKQAFAMAIVCLMIGMSVGYLARGSSPVKAPVVQAEPTQATQPPQASQPSMAMPTPDQLKRMADKKIEPLLEKLKQNPNEPALLAQIGNAYYDTQQLTNAIDYYQRSLKIDPKQANVRTDLGSALCRSGEIERGIKEFETVLKYDPAHDNAYLNMGAVKWQAMHDAKGAIDAWRQLLSHNPRYAKRAQIEQMIAQLEKVNVARN